MVRDPKARLSAMLASLTWADNRDLGFGVRDTKAG